MPSAGPVCDGETASVDVSGIDTRKALGNTTFTYKNLSGDGSVSIDQPATSSAAATVTGTSAGEANVRLIVEDEVGCKDSVDFSVTVKPIPAMLAQQNCGNCGKIKLEICEDAPFDLGDLVTSNNANYEEGATLQWYKNTGGAPGDAISGTATFNNNKPRKKRFWVSQVQEGCESDPIQVVVTVNPVTQSNINVPDRACEISQMDLAEWVTDASGTASSYTFFDSNPANGNPTPLGSASATNGRVDNGQRVIVDNVPGVYTYFVIADNTFGCSSDGSSTIEVFERPDIDPVSDVSADHGEPISVSFNGTSGAPIGWLNDNTDIGLGNSGLGNLNFVADNTTGQTQVANVRVFSIANSCMSDIETFSITVTPAPITRMAQSNLNGNFLGFAAQKANEHDVNITWVSAMEDFILSYEVEKRINSE